MLEILKNAVLVMAYDDVGTPLKADTAYALTTLCFPIRRMAIGIAVFRQGQLTQPCLYHLCLQIS